MSKYLLGLDIGTSSCKAALFTHEGKLAAQNSADYEVYYPHNGWAEQNAEDWWRGVCQSIKKLLASGEIKASDITAIGIDGQGWSAIPLDKDGNTLCNTPIWFDTRAEDICAELRQAVGEDSVFSVCGNPLQPAYTSPKLLWYKKHLPQVYEKINKVLISNNYIGYKLTSVIAQDVCQSYGYHCFDMQKGCYDTALAAEMGINTAMLPDICACHDIIGSVTASAAEQTGLMQGTPVAAGGLDAACGTLGVGVIHQGETQEQGGQAGGMSICIDKCKTDKRLIMSFHVVPDIWLLQGGTVGGGGVLRWFEANFGAEERIAASEHKYSSFEEMSREAGTIAPGCEGLVFLPYMSGERSPIWDPRAKGVYYGVDFAKTRAHFIRATMEGAAFALRHNLETAKNAGADTQELRAMGGSANSLVWTQIKADVTGKNIIVPSSDTATTLGAAILAGVGTGVYASFDDAVKQTVKVKRSHSPNAGNSEVYEKNYSLYIELYEKLKNTMHTY